jgi:hypothetical protein
MEYYNANLRFKFMSVDYSSVDKTLH